MGLPLINIIFKAKARSAIKRSSRGIVAIILKENSEGFTLQTFNTLLEVKPEQFSEQNYQYLKLVFEGGPSQVIVVRMPVDSDEWAAPLKQLFSLKWNYLTIPDLSDNGKTVVSGWIKSCREQKKKSFKAVLAHCAGDHEGIINYTTENNVSALASGTLSAAQYCARHAGALAGLSLARSYTYYVLNDLISADCPEDADERIDNGELVVIFDGKKYKIGRGVNSLTTFTSEKTVDLSKIKIVEGMDLYSDDIRETYEDNWVGKVINDYDNKQAFVAAIRIYQKALAGNVLDRSFEHMAAIDLEGQKEYLASYGEDVDAMSETQIAKANTGSEVFIASNIKFVDAMEDLRLVANM